MLAAFLSVLLHLLAALLLLKVLLVLAQPPFLHYGHATLQLLITLHHSYH